METTTQAAPIPVFAGAKRLLSLAHALFTLIGLAVVLAVALPASREYLMRQAGILSESLDSATGNVSAGTIQPVAVTAAGREQRAVADFIAKRYRVAQDAAANFVGLAYRAGSELKLDPLLILAVMAVESRYNPVAESALGAKGLMQVMPKFHLEKLADRGGEGALLEPDVNIEVGARILREYLRRFGETETALQMYGGSFDEPGSQYAAKVLAERARLAQLVKALHRAA